ncbi:hypothetical protein ENSA5_36450 [Enhygromyxa salina]|uniref:Uncharacterized protein n=1 Tax=Enhygromyxa salina TaxID=215803 RepID=A0A2S9XUL9_9BACT|nr:DUF4150 domain-containing protein [Enhygromyxa salina]PRP96569.1 hypothetical protein ENSA5_36450 [Enhygromyxa salina]
MTVYANNREIAAKKSSNKSVVSMPDVCLSPPPPPVGPIPLPYPLTALSSDTNKGCKTVLILGKQVMRKNSSEYKKSTGDEPATKSLGMGVVSHEITGPLKFSAYSTDVFAEGGNVCRLLDLTGANNNNTVNTTVSLGKFLAVSAERTSCEALHQQNTGDRERLGKVDTTQIEKYVQTATTTHFKLDLNGVSYFGKSRSREIPQKYDNGYTKPLTGTSSERRGGQGEGYLPKESDICGGGKHTYSNTQSNVTPDTAHTESRILEELWASREFRDAASMVAMGGGPKPRVTMAIDWPKPRDPDDVNSPCEDCRRLICAASSCIDVVICDAKRGKETEGQSYCDK